MKKIILVIVISAFLSACTTREENQKIMEFWNKQAQEVQLWFMSKVMKGNALPADFLSSMEAIKTESPATAPTGAASVTPSATKTAKAPASQGPIPAKLFLSDTCGWCRKLKQSGFPEKFRNKYADEIELKIYEVHSAQGNREFSNAVRKHNLSGGVPLLIIGNSVIHGYSDNMMELADEKVRIELKKRGPVAPAGPAIVSITMEDDAISGPASAADKVKMKAYLDRVRDNNEATLSSMRNMFPKQIWNQAVALVTDAENQLKKTANKSTTYEAFTKAAQPIEKAQQQKIDDLVRQNVKKIR